MINSPRAVGHKKFFGQALLLALMLFCLAAQPAAALNLKLGDIIFVDPGTSSIQVIDPTTGVQATLSQGGLLGGPHKLVGVALALDGDLIAVVRDRGLIRVNPASGEQSVLSEGGSFRDPWAIAIDHNNGAIYVADSGFDHDRPSINEAGKIIKVDPASGAQQVIASGSPCNTFPSGGACQNTNSPGSYLTHPYGIAVDYYGVPGTLVIADMSSFNGQGSIFRLNPLNGAQTLLWGPSSANPDVDRASPLGCPMGVTVEPTGNILVTAFTYPLPASPVYPPPAGTFYGCSLPGVYRINLSSDTQTILNANAPEVQRSTQYSSGSFVLAESANGPYVYRALLGGTTSFANPNWTSTVGGLTLDGTVLWRNMGPGKDWKVPFGMGIEPAPTQSNPSAFNILVADEELHGIYRINSTGTSVAEAGGNLGYPTTVMVVDFTPVGGFEVQPHRTDGQPAGSVLTYGTTQTVLSLSTDINATCRYSTTASVAYGSMTNTFSNTGSLNHSTTVSGLVNGGAYSYYVRCSTPLGQANTTDYVISFTVAATEPSTTPVAVYGFNENGGTTLSDLSGNQNHGTISGATWTQGKYGSALSFNGNSDFVTVPDVASLDLVTGMTLEAWVFPTSASGTRDVVIKEGSSSDIYNLYARNYQGLPESNVFVNGSNRTVAGPELPANTWTHLAATYDGSTVRLFVNGALAASTDFGGSISTSSGPLRIGGNSLWGEYFQGRIDEVRIYNRALTAGEIVADMNTPVAPVPDIVPPVRSSGSPSGLQPFGTTQVVLSLSTNENATCRYGTTPGTAYAFLTGTFTTTGSTSHSTTVSGLTNGATYTYYVRCSDTGGNVNTSDFSISFSVASVPGVNTSTFSGIESPLSEGGNWTIAGAWAAMSKNDGAYAPGLNALARRATPSINSDQYVEITYDQDPGSSSWVGAMTRVQSASNGSGYLVIAFAGEVRLYRTDDIGYLNFVQLASAPANLGAAPRRIRLESAGDHHRVYFNGGLLIDHNASGTTYVGGQPGVAGSTFGGPMVRILTYESGNLADSSAPVRSNGSPAGSQPYGTTQVVLSLSTNEDATCRYGTTPGTAYASLTGNFTTTGSTSHSTTVSGLTNGGTYTYYVRCSDASGNANTDDFSIGFSVSATPGGNSSTFAGIEYPLTEGGVWTTSGSWAAMGKNDGAYAPGLNALARRDTPGLSSNQYVEITFDQDPGASSWTGAMTRVQSASNGSGYLVIAYAGEVRLYRTDDIGFLNFVQLASAPANLSAAPRRIRLESSGSNHRVYYNGSLVIDYNDASYTGGQPGVAGSTFGGPTVRILSYESGGLP